MAKENKAETPFVTDERLDSVAIIMDGNGRWAKRRLLPRTAGHVAGAKNMERVLNLFRAYGVHHITLYAFSTENWKRPREEVDALMQLAVVYLRKMKEKLLADPEIQIRFLGDKAALPESVRTLCLELEAMGTGKPFTVNVALNYGGRDEIVHAANAAIRDGHTELTPEILSSYLYTKESPDPDLVIRTGGDLRISNFLLWQSAYSEFYFTKTLWPDFGRREIEQAITAFYGRKRRFGGLDKEDLNPS